CPRAASTNYYTTAIYYIKTSTPTPKNNNEQPTKNTPAPRKNTTQYKEKINYVIMLLHNPKAKKNKDPETFRA
ncbi:hypothetical protein LXA52_18040, partial [Erwinia amylovora]|uniref:hypothetical protein n=1 Tax=Erwinia amylovora TaxID=552 RepID=UPI0020BD6305